MVAAAAQVTSNSPSRAQRPPLCLRRARFHLRVTLDFTLLEAPLLCMCRGNFRSKCAKCAKFRCGGKRAKFPSRANLYYPPMHRAGAIIAAHSVLPSGAYTTAPCCRFATPSDMAYLRDRVGTTTWRSSMPSSRGCISTLSMVSSSAVSLASAGSVARRRE